MGVKKCRICSEILTEQIIIKEMQLGLRESFDYGVCCDCGCIQIIEAPGDLEKYYPSHYAPFNAKAPVLKKLPPFKRIFKTIRIKRKYLQGTNPLLNYFRPMNTGTGAKILDIGCGNGALMCDLY